jgi:ferritin-like metal-binding protein YciE
MAKEAKTLDDLFHDTLKDIYYAEKKILATLPKMAKAAQSEELRAAFEKHKAETEEQIGRLEQVFAAIDKKPQGKTCDAIVGITDEGAEIMKEYKGSPARCRPPRRRAGGRALRNLPLRDAHRLGGRAWS